MKQAQELKWEDPPTDIQEGRAKWEPIFEEVRKAKGQWALLPGTYGSNHASLVRAGKFKGIEPGEFEAVSKKDKDSERFLVWVRCVK